MCSKSILLTLALLSALCSQPQAQQTSVVGNNAKEEFSKIEKLINDNEKELLKPLTQYIRNSNYKDYPNAVALVKLVKSNLDSFAEVGTQADEAAKRSDYVGATSLAKQALQYQSRAIRLGTEVKAYVETQNVSQANSTTQKGNGSLQPSPTVGVLESCKRAMTPISPNENGTAYFDHLSQQQFCILVNDKLVNLFSNCRKLEADIEEANAVFNNYMADLDGFCDKLKNPTVLRRIEAGTQFLQANSCLAIFFKDLTREVMSKRDTCRRQIADEKAAQEKKLALERAKEEERVAKIKREEEARAEAKRMENPAYRQMRNCQASCNSALAPCLMSARGNPVLGNMCHENLSPCMARCR